MQRTELIGIVTTSPETTVTDKGVKAYTFTMSVDQTYGECTDFYRVVTWNNDAVKMIEKGSMVFASGELHPHLYKSNGNTLMTLDLIADRIEPFSMLETA